MPADGSVDGHAILPGTSLHFTCNSGFFLEGGVRMTCLSNGTYMGAVPKCVVALLRKLPPVRLGLCLPRLHAGS